MKTVNKDYISVVRNNSGRLHFERIPIVKSEKAKNKLIAMAEDDRFTLEDMDGYLRQLPMFKFLALPYYEYYGDIDMDEPEDFYMNDLTKELKAAKTKVKYLERAMDLVEECDYRWNVIRITNSLPDILIRSHAEYESIYLDINITKDMSVVFQSEDLDDCFGGNLCFTVYKNNTPLLPYRSVVEYFECSDDILDATRVFDPEAGQWDNALRCFTNTVNAILDNPDAFCTKNVFDAGQEMLEKIKLMCLDVDSYYAWQEKASENITIDYSECEKSQNALQDKDESNRSLYELYMKGNKMVQAIQLSENLSCWAKEGIEFYGLEKTHTDLKSMAAGLLHQMDRVHHELPGELFTEDDGEFDLVTSERSEVAKMLRSACETLRESLSKQPRCYDQDNN